MGCCCGMLLCCQFEIAKAKPQTTRVMGFFFDLCFALASKRVLLQNHYANQIHFHMKTCARKLEKETEGNTEMAILFVVV